MKKVRKTLLKSFALALANPSADFCDRCGRLPGKCRCKKVKQ